MLSRFLQHHVLANLTFVLVLVLGFSAYNMMPREKMPPINFNWIQITTVMPGASAGDVERLITEPLEDAVANVGDIRFISSTSREGVSAILIRFEDIDQAEFDKRVTDLRREVQSVESNELPEAAHAPFIYEITSANAFPSATLVLSGAADDEGLRSAAQRLENELEQRRDVERVDTFGLRDPELQVAFDARQLAVLGLTPGDLADTVRDYFRDLSAGTVTMDGVQVLMRMVGTADDPGVMAELPVIAAQGEVPLGRVAEVRRGREEASNLARYRGRPAIILSVFKKEGVNTLELVDRLNNYLVEQNRTLSGLGLSLELVDDQTTSTREAIGVMQTNALLGLLLVLLVTWLFLGSRIALFITIGIPFTLAATFWVLSGLGQSINNSVLLGVVISLGMLVDDAVVVVEGIYHRIRLGMEATRAAVASLREVFAPVTASVLTTIAAFLPLMLLPGILGKFMFVIPLVVTLALAISLLEAYWLLPAHVIAARVNFDRPSRIQRRRERFTHWLQVRYGQLLIKVLRRPLRALGVVGLVFVATMGALGSGKVHVNFFAMEAFRLFYVNIEMPAGTPLERSMALAEEAERRVRSGLREGEARALVAYAGAMFTESEPLLGDHYAQVMVSLNPKTEAMRETGEIIAVLRELTADLPGVAKLYYFEMKDGPPVTKPIVVKVRGDDFDRLAEAVTEIKQILTGIDSVTDITDSDSPGAPELVMTLDHDAVRRSGVSAATLYRTIQLLGDGEVVGSVQIDGERVDIRVQGQQQALQDLDALLRTTVPLPGGGEVALSRLIRYEVAHGRSDIRHHNLRRSITVEAELDQERMDTVTANRLLQERWAEVAPRYPGVDLDFTGEMDDIKESQDAIQTLFIFGIGLIYLILGTQFRSYFQPLLILVTIPMAFTGVVLGLLITGNPLSLYTLYGVVALGGIAVNAAIVLISAANDRIASGMSVLHATLYAARRRVIPILITSLTTIAGLFSLATGLGGHSVIWGPVATAITWGLAFSTVLTLFVIPLLYRFFMTRRHARTH